jgi:uncharacterized protein
VNATFKPHQLDITALAQAGTPLSGSLPLQKLERLTHYLCGPEADFANILLPWQVKAEVRQVLGGQPQIWLHLGCQALLPMTCQRCLEPVQTPVEFEQSYRFVATEKQAEQEDETSEEDLLVISKRFNLLELLEDELLMHLPMVPKHDTCPTSPNMSFQDADFDAALEDKPKPFAGLGVLKKG